MPAKKRKIVEARPVKSLKGLEAQYRVQMMRLGRAVAGAVKTELLPMLKKEQSAYVVDGIATNLNAVFASLNQRFTGAATIGFAQQIATQAVTKTEKANKRRFDKSVKAATGVDLGAVLSAEGLEEFTQLNVSNNVSLIKSLPEEYLKSVETIVTNGVSSGARFSTIEKQITAKIGSANSKLVNRIKTIATDQIQTINSQITLRRSEKLGITKGTFRTSEDERVRKCHAELNGIEYDLAKGAWSKTCKKFIQPGITDIRCRCSYSPVIVIEEPGEAIEQGVKKAKIKAVKAPKMPVEVKPKPVKKPVIKAKTPKEKFEEREALSKRLKKQGVSEEEKQKQLNELREKQGLTPLEPKAKPAPKPKPIKKPVKAPIKKAETAEPILTKAQIRKNFKPLETKSKRELEKVFKEQKAILPDDILEYVKAFEINPALRSGKTAALSKRHKQAIKGLDKILSKTELKEGVQLNRGLTFKTRGELDKFITGMDTGTVHEDASYISTTIGEIPEQFLAKKIEPFSVKIKILADKNTKGAYIPNFKTGGIEENEEAFEDFIDEEKEFLLPRNTKFEIIETPKVTKDGRATVVMRVIEPVKAPKIAPVKKVVKPSKPVQKPVPVEDFEDLSKKSLPSVEKLFTPPNKNIPEGVLGYVKDSFDVNSALRKAKSTGEKSILDRFSDQIKEIDEELDVKTLKESVQLNRGLFFESKKELNNFLKPFDVGAIQEDGAYVSTTVGEVSSAFFEFGEGFPVKMKILADENTKGVYLNTYKKFPEKLKFEQEFLLPKNTKFQVLSREKKKEFEEIVMKVINE